jgi:hypothetical protein
MVCDRRSALSRALYAGTKVLFCSPTTLSSRRSCAMLWPIPVDTHSRGSTDGHLRTTDALQPGYCELAHNYCLLGTTNELFSQLLRRRPPHRRQLDRRPSRLRRRSAPEPGRGQRQGLQLQGLPAVWSIGARSRRPPTRFPIRPTPTSTCCAASPVYNGHFRSLWRPNIRSKGASRSKVTLDIYHSIT